MCVSAEDKSEGTDQDAQLLEHAVGAARVQKHRGVTTQ